MNSLAQLRQQQNRIALGVMGRHPLRPKVYDGEVRADSAAWDFARLPVDIDACGSLQDEKGDFLFVAGLDDLEGPLPL